eukprot:scaffold77129_cov18-Prasinocladus_malaysianus.AAC.3
MIAVSAAWILSLTVVSIAERLCCSQTAMSYETLKSGRSAAGFKMLRHIRSFASSGVRSAPAGRAEDKLGASATTARARLLPGKRESECVPYSKVCAFASAQCRCAAVCRAFAVMYLGRNISCVPAGDETRCCPECYWVIS